MPKVHRGRYVSSIYEMINLSVKSYLTVMLERVGLRTRMPSAISRIPLRRLGMNEVRCVGARTAPAIRCVYATLRRHCNRPSRFTECDQCGLRLLALASVIIHPLWRSDAPGRAIKSIVAGLVRGVMAKGSCDGATFPERVIKRTRCRERRIREDDYNAFAITHCR
jgi:hypothetical protein